MGCFKMEVCWCLFQRGWWVFSRIVHPMRNQEDYTSWNSLYELRYPENYTSCIVIRRITHLETIPMWSNAVLFVFSKQNCWNETISTSCIIRTSIDNVLGRRLCWNMCVNPETPLLLFSARLEALWGSYGQFNAILNVARCISCNCNYITDLIMGL